MALPALGPEAEPRQIIDPLVEVLVGMLPLAFLFLRLNATDSGQAIEILRIGESFEGSILERDIGSVMAKLAGHGWSWPLGERVTVGEVDLSMASAQLGLQGELGILVAASGTVISRPRLNVSSSMSLRARRLSGCSTLVCWASRRVVPLRANAMRD